MFIPLEAGPTHLAPPPRNQISNISQYYNHLANLTTDFFVLDIVKHDIKLDFCTKAIYHNFTPRCSLPAEGFREVNADLKTLLIQNIISPVTLKADSFVSSIFTTKKSDGSHYTIFNLEKLNESTNYVHFKMELLKNVRQLMKSGVWMGSIDLKDAYYSVWVN